jgi:hypothetical protein
MCRRRCVTSALQASADRDEADVGGIVALDLDATLDGAEVSLAASAIVAALKISADFDAGTDKPALLRALHDLHASVHGHATLENRGRAPDRLDIAGDRRRLRRCVDGESCVLQDLHVSGYGRVRQRTAPPIGHDNIAGDVSA